MNELIKKDKLYEEGAKILILGLKVLKPDLTDKQAKRFIANVGLYLQLQILKEENART